MRVIPRSMSMVVATLSLAVLIPGPAHAVASCSTNPAYTSTSPSDGGDWSWDGQDLLGQRNQTAETTIGALNVATLVTKWTTTIPANSGQLSMMPIIANGCVYLQTGHGTSNATNKYKVVALNAETGQLVWSYDLGASGAMAAPHVVGGVVYVNEPTAYLADSRKGPHVVALDALSGALLWSGATVCQETGCANVAGATSPAMYYDGFVWIGLTNTEKNGSREGGFAIVDAATGGSKLLKRTYTVPADRFPQYGGCSIWSTPAVDPVTRYAYVGVGQPSTWGVDDASGPCNSIIKFDLARARDANGNPVAYTPGTLDPQYTNPNFGEIVARMKGTVDSTLYTDVDFGGSGATILNDANGKQIVAQEQKSGVLWAAFTDTMTNAWSSTNGYASQGLGAYAKTATDGSSLFTVGVGGPPVLSHNGTNGLVQWVGPAIAPVTAGSLAYANGLVYFTDETGTLFAYSSLTGTPLLVHAIANDGSGCSAGVSNAYGTTVARHRVFAVCGTRVVALGLP